MSTSLMVQLAQQITESVAKIDRYHEDQGIAKPTFDIDTPAKQLYPADIEDARQQVFSATTDLRDLVLGPRDALKVRAESYADLVSLHLIYKFGIAESFPVDGEARFKDIAMVSGLTEPATRRILRQAVQQKIFKEPRPGVVAHTAATQTLAEDDQLKDFLGMCVDELWKASPRVTDALQSWPTASELGQTPYALATESGNPVYVELSKYPERSRRFGNAIRQYKPELATMSPHLVDAYDWGSLGSGKFVDIGGYGGYLSVTLARKFPELQFVVQNSSHIIKDLELSASEPQVADRIEYMANNFFLGQAVQGADVYYWRWNLHNLPDRHVVDVLKNLIPSLKNGSKLLMHDFLVPEDPAGMNYGEVRQMRMIDVTQLILWNTRERSLTQWKMLFANADTRFKFLGVTGTKDSLPIIEAVWTGD